MDLFDIVVAKKLSDGGGGGATIEALSVTENGTYTAPSGVDGYSPVTVNVSGGGGGSSYMLLAEDDVVVSNPSSSGSGSIVKTFNLDPAIVYTSDKIIYVRIRIKSDYVRPHTVCADSFSLSPNASTGSTSNMSFQSFTYNLNADGTWKRSSYGFAPTILADGTINIYAKADTVFGYDINGTYHVEVYSLDWPDGVSPFYIE